MGGASVPPISIIKWQSSQVALECGSGAINRGRQVAEPREIAEAFLLVIKRLAKWAAVGLFGIACLVAFAAGGLYLFNYVSIDRHKSKIKVTVSYDLKQCTTELPLLVFVGNDSGRTVSDVTVYLSAVQVGHSTDYADSSQGIISDRIIAPGEFYRLCSQAKLGLGHQKRDAAVLNWGVRSFAVRFQ